MADYVRTQQRGVPDSMQTRYRDMSDGTHAQVMAVHVLNPSSNEFTFGEITGALVTIDLVHHEVHEGEFYSVSYKTADASPLADNATLCYVITTGAKYVHFFGLGACGGDAEVEFTEAPTITGGTAMTPYNHQRYSTNTSTVTVVRDPTVNTAGTVLVNYLMPGGQGPRAVGGTGVDRNEWILKTSTKYMLRITNRSGNTQPASLAMNWYEEEDA